MIEKHQEKPNFFSRVGAHLDDAISLFAPTWAATRALNRLSYLSLRKYAGAQVNKTDKSWNAQNNDADTEIITDLPRLRARSRALVRDNPWANGIIESFVRNVIGSEGIRPQVHRTQANAEALEEYILEQMNNADITGMNNNAEMQAISLRRLLEDGEIFQRIVIDRNSYRPAVKLQLIEADQIYSGSDVSNNGNEIRAGIEIDQRTGRHVAYYVNAHPGAYARNKSTLVEQRILAQDMIHLFIRTRPNQTRGVPILAPVINVLRDMGEYVEAKLVTTRVAACMGLVIKSQARHPGDKNSDGDKIESIRPGMVARLKPGEDISFINPAQPGDSLAPFTALLHRSLSAATGLAYETGSKDYTQTSFSSARTSKLEERVTFRYLQGFIVNRYCKRLVDEIMTLRYLDGMDRKKIAPRIKYQTPGFEWVDPEKEIKAAEREIEANLTTKAAVIAARGGNIDDVLEGRSIEVAREKELGIYGLNKPNTATAGNDGEPAATDAGEYPAAKSK